MISAEKDRASGSSGGRNSTAQSQSLSSSQSGSKLSLSFAPIVLVSDSGQFCLKLAVQQRYNLNLFLSVLTGSLQGFAERPLPCSCNVIPSVIALSRRRRGFKSRRGRHTFNDLHMKA